MPEFLPKPYIVLENHITKMRHDSSVSPTKTWEEFKGIAQECGLPDEDLAKATVYLSGLGIIAYFPDVDPDLVILEPQWLINIFVQLLEVVDLPKPGMLPLSYFKDIWRPPNYPEKFHSVILSLLEHFDIVFRRPHSDLLFFPCLLPDEPSVNFFHHWPLHKRQMDRLMKWHQFGRFYQFEMLPLGFFGRLLMRLFSGQKWKPIEYWKRGAILLYSEEAEIVKVLLELDEVSHTLKFTVRAENPVEHLFSMINNIL